MDCYYFVAVLCGSVIGEDGKGAHALAPISSGPATLVRPRVSFAQLAAGRIELVLVAAFELHCGKTRALTPIGLEKSCGRQVQHEVDARLVSM